VASKGLDAMNPPSAVDDARPIELGDQYLRAPLAQTGCGDYVARRHAGARVES
jgi:hypothetical protein